MDIYQQNILDYYKHPRARGELNGATHTSQAANPSCGDSVQLYLKTEGGRVLAAQWMGEGCVLSQAAADMLAEYLVGKTIAQARAVASDDILKLVGVQLGPNRLKCALLPLDALRSALTSG